MEEVVVEARFHTGDPSRPGATGVLVRDGRLAVVGAIAECLRAAHPRARRLRAASGVAGLVDAHGHPFLLGRASLEVPLGGVRDEAACADLVAQRARAIGTGRWIQGGGWDETRWPGATLPGRESLDRVARDNPVVLARVDRHLSWVNGAALAAAGIGPSTIDPPGGRIIRRPDGSPAGLLVDAAQDLVLHHVPAPTAAEVEAALVAGLAALPPLGITAVHDAGVGPHALERYGELAAEDRLPVRVYAMVDGQVPVADLAERIAPWTGGRDLGRLAVRAVKLFADGALGSRGAALFEDYADDPGNRGLLLHSRAELAAAVRAVVGARLQPAIHAIGDRAIAEVVAALESAGAPDAVAALRPRLEHLQVLRLAELPSLARLGAVASMQPVHVVGDGAWAVARLGEGSRRLGGAYAWRSVLRAGIPLAFGSDFPVESADPRAGMVAAELRAGRGGSAPFGATERLSRGETLRAYTIGAAWAAHAEGRTGMIREGLEADLTLFDGDVAAAPPDEVRDMRVVHTIVGGRVEWSADGQSSVA